MTNEQLLRQAIEKAEKNGWDAALLLQRWGVTAPTLRDFYPLIIFNHDFARAFWGEPMMTMNNDKRFLSSGTMTYGWQFHLQHLVLEEEPLKYLETFL